MESFGGASCPPVLEDVVSETASCSLLGDYVFPAAPRVVPSRYSLDHLLSAWVVDAQSRFGSLPGGSAGQMVCQVTTWV